MVIFLCGIAVLILGYFTYGKFVEKLFEPDMDRQTPAFSMKDGVDYLPMNIHQNSLVQLLNIAGTGPIFGPIIGVLWGPIVFIIIPIGNILGGGVHDYFSGMLSVREKGGQITMIVKKYLGRTTYYAFNIILVLLLLLVGAVFITIPGNIILYNFFDITVTNLSSFFTTTPMIVFGLIFVYYVIATLLPVDKVIGRIYPFFGAALIVSAIGVFLALFYKDGWMEAMNDFTSLDNFGFDKHPQGLPLFPLLFTTIACGIVSGFHASQSPIISRTLRNEKEGRFVFYGMMVLEGIIAMIWAAGGVIARNVLMPEGGAWDTTTVVVEVSKAALPGILGTIAIVGLIILPLTSGDTSLRGLRIIISDNLKMDQKQISKRLILAIPIFIIVFLIVIWGKIDADGFDSLWRYFAWLNQSVAVFVLFMASAYLFVKFKGKLTYLIALIPAIFYSAVVMTFLFGGNATREKNFALTGEATLDIKAEIGFMLGYGNSPYGSLSYILGILTTILFLVSWIVRVRSLAKNQEFEIS